MNDCTNEIREGLKTLRGRLVDKYVALGLRACGTWPSTLGIKVKQRAGAIFGGHYTPYMIYGRPAGGMPPVSKIRMWARCKGLARGLSDKKLNGLAWAIATKIAREGSRRHRNVWYAPLVDEALSDEAVADAFRPLVNKIGYEIERYFTANPLLK